MHISWQTQRSRPVEDIGDEATQLEEDVALPAEDENEEEEDCIETLLLLNSFHNAREVHFETI